MYTVFLFLVIHTAKTKGKKIAAGLLGSVALCSFLTGVTEPLEFSFKKIKSAGAAGVIRPSKTSVQIIIGPKVQFVADEFKKLL